MTRPIQLPVTQALGRHVLLELYQCPAELLKAEGELEEFLKAAAELMGATVVTSNFHQFSPYGISGVVIIQESHLTLHTWPEHRYAAVDIFTCGEIDLEAGIEYLIQAFRAETADWKLYERGKGL
ncbi:adenosylmethionine decarboxylase [Phaeodactylibacter xiamenensis]|uniref:adenosylmethionine decarboxylase n=1 Tax=Phaeodactylibacter xiamenensis TaxID=1524460 RepID=UPI0024A9DA87|nr:adenosylmethionine decarboxylase [Phaeodactylibacter xiamenensis]